MTKMNVVKMSLMSNCTGFTKRFNSFVQVRELGKFFENREKLPI